MPLRPHARSHFESHLDVDEEETLGRFMNAVRKVAPPSASAEPSAVGKRTAARRAADRGGESLVLNSRYLLRPAFHAAFLAALAPAQQH
jgi:hypothetical protein